jgi:hypothetical protein
LGLGRVLGVVTQNPTFSGFVTQKKTQYPKILGIHTQYYTQYYTQYPKLSIHTNSCTQQFWVLGKVLGMNTQNFWLQLHVCMDNILHNLHN